MDLPDKLEDVFGLLAKGRHISSQDAELFVSLNEHTARYREIFQAMGFELVADPHGFFYFNGSKRGNVRGVEQFALFVYIMVDWLSDNDTSIEDGLYATPRHIEDLPHLKSDRYRGYLKQAGIGDAEDLRRVIGRMASAGFLRINNEKIEFLSPTRRIMQVCLKLAPRVSTIEDDVEGASA